MGLTCETPTSFITVAATTAASYMGQAMAIALAIGAGVKTKKTFLRCIHVDSADR